MLTTTIIATSERHLFATAPRAGGFVRRAKPPGGAARALCRDILAGLQLLGARVIFVTHLHELVDDLLAPHAPAAGVVSLVAGVAPRAGNGSQPAPDYTIRPGRPQVARYAAELARQHGLSLAQIAATLRERGLMQE